MFALTPSRSLHPSLCSLTPREMTAPFLLLAHPCSPRLHLSHTHGTPGGCISLTHTYLHLSLIHTVHQVIGGPPLPHPSLSPSLPPSLPHSARSGGRRASGCNVWSLTHSSASWMHSNRAQSASRFPSLASPVRGRSQPRVSSLSQALSAFRLPQPPASPAVNNTLACIFPFDCNSSTCNTPTLPATLPILPATLPTLQHCLQHFRFQHFLCSFRCYCW